MNKEKEDLKANLGQLKEVGLALGIICPGTVPVKWMMHMINMDKSLPGGLYWNYIYAMGDFKKDPSKNYASLRTEVVNKALESKAKWLLFLDSDVFLPKDAVNRLMSHNKDIVNGIYWMKTQPPQPVIYNQVGDGPIWNITPQDELLKIGGAGLGCCLIKMDVFRKFQEKGIDFFKQDWIYRKNQRRVQVSLGEDHWFFEQARELGFDIWCDTNVMCDHYAVDTDLFFPGEKVVRQIASKKLIDEGQGAIVDHQLMIRNVEKTSPTIVFYNANAVKFHGDSIKEKPIAGSETAVIEMAKNMKKIGWNVHVFCNCDQEGIYDNVSYHHYSKINDGMDKLATETGKAIDVFISSRDIRPLEGRPPAKKTILWCHDMPSEAIRSLSDFMVNIDHIFFVSDFQKNEYQKFFNNALPEEKCFITSNGVADGRFDNKKGLQKQRGLCVYSTTPFRGLEVLLGIWPKIKARVPNAELHIYSDMSIYGMKNDLQYERIFDLAKKMTKHNLHLHKPVKQEDLAEILIESDLMLYPNHFPETSCITAMETISAGTPIITSNLGALKETVKSDEGILIDGDSHSPGYEEKFIEATVKMLTDDAYRNSFCAKKRDLSWSSVADKWNVLFGTGMLKNRISVGVTADGKDNFNTPEYWDRKYMIYERKGKNDVAIKSERKRYEEIAPLMPKHGSILDIGCGDGEFQNYLIGQQIGSSLHGADISLEALKIADKKLPQVDWIHISPEPYVLPKKDLQMITAFHLIEHLENPEKYIECWKQSLANDGVMILIIPLEDDEYYEHLKIYNLGDIEKLAKKCSNDYDIKTRTLDWKYKDGRRAKEAVIRLRFN